MDEKKYLELRDLVRERSAVYTIDQEFLVKFVNALERRVNTVVGREHEVCVAGRMSGTKFIKDEYDVSGSTLGFTLQIEFHDAKKNALLTTHVDFIAEATVDTLKVTCKSTSDWLDQPRAAANTEEGQLAVVALLDQPVSEAVEEALNMPTLQ